MAGVYFQADYGLAIVRPEHQAFYRRVFLQEILVRTAIVTRVSLKPVGLMAAHLPTVREKVSGPVSVSCVRAPSSGGCCSSAAVSNHRHPRGCNAFPVSGQTSIVPQSLGRLGS